MSRSTFIPPDGYRYLTEADVAHFLDHGWLLVPDAINRAYIGRWMADLWDRVGYDPHDESTWHTEYLHLPRHREVRAEEFAPKAWDAVCDLVGGEDRLDEVRERWHGDQFICNFGNADRMRQPTADGQLDPEQEPKRVPERPQDRTTWHIDNDWFRQFLDSSGVALTIVHCFTDILPDGGGTILAEDAIKGG
jgi:hypothetical protein